MTCKDCIHYDVCLDKGDYAAKHNVEFAEEECLFFRDKADFVEVVRCKDCDVPHNRWTGCPNLNGLIPPPDFFCGCGARKKGDANDIPTIEHNSLCETETYKVEKRMDYDEEFIQEVTEATRKGLAVPYATERLLRIIEKRDAEIENLKAMTRAELDTIHKLGDDYERLMENVEEQKVIIENQNAQMEWLQSVIKEILDD